ncbi:MAG: hypothetical protein ABJL67_05790 [Sulfitobacter sp.]
MTDATYFGRPFSRSETADEPICLPAPNAPAAGPVFINDCVTPFGGETLLSLLMKRMMQDDQP